MDHPLNTLLPTTFSPFKLNFSNLWNPSPISTNDFSCYISFVNDCSCFTYVFLFKHKSDVLSTFVQFLWWISPYHVYRISLDINHRTISLTIITLLSQMSLLLSYWDHAFLIAVYTILCTLELCCSIHNHLPMVFSKLLVCQFFAA